MELRSSDPELETIPYRVETLDRRVVMKSKRPRSLDLSSWTSITSMASSGASSSHTSSSGSQGTSPTVSRAGSCASDTRSESNTSDSSWSTGQPVMSAQKSEPGTLTREAAAAAAAGENQKSKAEQVQRTVTTLMGGRGCIQWR